MDMTPLGQGMSPHLLGPQSPHLLSGPIKVPHRGVVVKNLGNTESLKDKNHP